MPAGYRRSLSWFSLLLGPAHGGRTVGLHPRGFHLFFLRRTLRRGPDRFGQGLSDGTSPHPQAQQVAGAPIVTRVHDELLLAIFRGPKFTAFAEQNFLDQVVICCFTPASPFGFVLPNLQPLIAANELFI